MQDPLLLCCTSLQFNQNPYFGARCMLTNSRLVHQPHDHGRCINAAMTRAHDLCIEQNARMTTTRESVLRLLWQSHRPLGAYQLQDQLAELLNKPIAPPTVYRAIEFLLQLGLIHRLPSLNAYIGPSQYGSGRTSNANLASDFIPA